MDTHAQHAAAQVAHTSSMATVVEKLQPQSLIIHNSETTIDNLSEIPTTCEDTMVVKLSIHNCLNSVATTGCRLGEITTTQTRCTETKGMSLISWRCAQFYGVVLVAVRLAI